TSVWYTSAASTSPRITRDRAARTSCSSVTGVSSTPAASSAVAAAAPHGTCAAHRATVTPGSARSARPVMPSGLPAGTAMTSWLRVNVTGAPALPPASVTVCIVAGLAAANTSAGAPSLICWANVELPAKLNVTDTSGCASSNCSPSWVNESVSDAAANTTNSPLSWLVAAPPGSGDGGGSPSAQPATARHATSATATHPGPARSVTIAAAMIIFPGHR